jgi:hypothetical protein
MPFQMPPFRSVSFIAREYVTEMGDKGQPGRLLRGDRLAVQAVRPGCLRVEAITTEADRRPGERGTRPRRSEPAQPRMGRQRTARGANPW